MGHNRPTNNNNCSSIDFIVPKYKFSFRKVNMGSRQDVRVGDVYLITSVAVVMPHT